LKRRTDGEKAKRWLAFLHNHREVMAASTSSRCPL
jgi:hypothetical protein